MSNTIKILAVFTWCGMALTLAGCGPSEPDVPLTAAEKVKAIEANTQYTPEEKERYKKQVAEVEKQIGMASKMAPPTKKP